MRVVGTPTAAGKFVTLYLVRFGSSGGGNFTRVKTWPDSPWYFYLDENTDSYNY